ncbi:MAG: hypothetical protein FJZ01_13965 [Candidatus Sericytochromatia bacterium]|nr:hypothetical protein [Candidatus Tanganyikabacteria bacterium]
MTFEIGFQGACAPEELQNANAIALEINKRAAAHPVFRSAKRAAHPDQHTAWRISPEPFCISKDFYRYLSDLGDHLLAFYRSANKLYQEAAHGRQPAWILEYLDRGKPEHLVDYGRMNRFKNQLPGIIRPDLVMTEEGRAICCELDAIPGGMGSTASMAEEYVHHGFEVVGGARGMVEGFARMIRDQIPENPEPRLAITVSDEAGDYWVETQWLGEQLNTVGLRTVVIKPEQLHYSDNGLFFEHEQIDVLYRFFELFDLKNIPKAEIVTYLNKKEKIRVTPPFKTYLEEKALFALFHHPALAAFWEAELPATTLECLESLLPRTWLLDPRPLPPYGVIPGLFVAGRPATGWSDLFKASKKGRQMVVKPSGFSPLAWGSRGITFGHNVPAEEWEATLKAALEAFGSGTVYLLQEFHKPARVDVRYYDFFREEIVPMQGRARVCPYYYVVGGHAELSGILVTVCPADKLAIHGMVDSIMVPARVEGS